ncbi:MAG: hypothetical protein WD772_00230 [Pseudohongiellaceae bacterium]
MNTAIHYPGSAKWITLLIGCLLPVQAYAQSSIPLPILSIDDHLNERPLFDALTRRVAGLEVDVYLVEDELRIGQHIDLLTKGRTLTNLYLEPLRLLSMRNNGQVYEDASTPLVLILDIKTDAMATYKALQRVMAGYERMLTRYSMTSTLPGTISLIITGNYSSDLLASEAERFVAIQGSVTNLTDADFNRHLSPVISLDWSGLFVWDGSGEMPADQLESLSMVSRMIRDAGAISRMLKAPPSPAVWRVLQSANIDLVDSDQVEFFGLFLRSNGL